MTCNLHKNTFLQHKYLWKNNINETSQKWIILDIKANKLHFPDIYEQFHQLIKQNAIFCKVSFHLVDKYKMIKIFFWHVTSKLLSAPGVIKYTVKSIFFFLKRPAPIGGRPQEQPLKNKCCFFYYVTTIFTLQN